MIALRTCNICYLIGHDEESLKLFVKNKVAKFGRENICKECNKKRNRLYREDNIDLMKEAIKYLKEYRQVEKEVNKAKGNLGLGGLI